jgi:hypothetical protein
MMRGWDGPLHRTTWAALPVRRLLADLQVLPRVQNNDDNPSASTQTVRYSNEAHHTKPLTWVKHNMSSAPCWIGEPSYLLWL